MQKQHPAHGLPLLLLPPARRSHPRPQHTLQANCTKSIYYCSPGVCLLQAALPPKPPILPWFALIRLLGIPVVTVRRPDTDSPSQLCPPEVPVKRRPGWAVRPRFLLHGPLFKGCCWSLVSLALAEKPDQGAAFCAPLPQLPTTLSHTVGLASPPAGLGWTSRCTLQWQPAASRW